jgi:hypothetical protein
MPIYAAMFAMPAVIWLIAEERLGTGRAVLLGLLIAYQCLTDLVYVGGPLLVLVGLATAWNLSRASTRARGTRLLLASSIAVLLLLPFVVGYVAVRLANPALRSQSVWSTTGGLAQVVWVLRAWPPTRGPLRIDTLAFLPAVLGLAAWFVGGAGVERNDARAWRCAALWFAFGLAISWVLPYSRPSWRAVISATLTRDMLRLGYGAVIAAGLLVGLGFAACLRAVAATLPPAPRRVVSLVLLTAVLAGRVAHLPFPVGDYPVREVPRRGSEAAILAERPGPVLAIPANDANANATVMYRTIGGWPRLVNGYSGYYPEGFDHRMELAMHLPNAQALADLRRETDVATIVVYGGQHPSLSYAPWHAALTRHTITGVTVLHEDRDALVLDVSTSPR